ncbi:helix-turn-helix domain-containing protein [Agromyces sp. CFH 90414]|uniref:Helix-turn-helix domain-containing protein n=2 Tax=Agromyces agglutinans TaxID=2662258 RepID=A0A6I2F5T3_9MICO|nr:helix-turn-helix domain-containing protein [Agromyces agglutinans]
MDIMNESQIVSVSAPASASVDGWGLDRLMGITELAAYLGVPVSTVYDWRTHGKGPAAYRFGKHLKFAVADVRAWVAEQRESA